MSKMTMEAVVKNVEPRKIKDDTQTIYDIVDGNEVKWTAWEKDLAEQAWKLKGQPSLWQVKVEQNGKYTNRTLIAIQAKGMEGFDAALNTSSKSLGSFSDATHSPTGKDFPSDDSPTEKDTKIWRQTATKVAAWMNPNSPDEFWANVSILMNFYETGQNPLQDNSTGFASEPFKGDDDIPF